VKPSVQNRTNLDPAARHFALWGLARLGIDVVEEQDRFIARFPPRYGGVFNRENRVTFAFEPVDFSHEPVESLAPASAAFRWLVDELYRRHLVREAVPFDQPNGVAHLAQLLFPAYGIEDGNVQLAGCTLEDRLIFRFDYGPCGGENAPVEQAAFVDVTGCEVNDEARQLLGLDRLRDSTMPRRLRGKELARMIRLADIAAANEGRSAAGESGMAAGGKADLLSATGIWCKHAQGKLRFRIGHAMAELPFSGWARTLVPPPFVCRESGITTYELAVTDDGRIVAAEAVGTCAVSGQRVVNHELRRCAATGLEVLAELTALCPLSGETVLRSSLVRCEDCGQEVSPRVVIDGRCEACRRAKHG